MAASSFDAKKLCIELLRECLNIVAKSSSGMLRADFKIQTDVTYYRRPQPYQSPGKIGVLYAVLVKSPEDIALKNLFKESAQTMACGWVFGTPKLNLIGQNLESPEAVTKLLTKLKDLKAKNWAPLIEEIAQLKSASAKAMEVKAREGETPSRIFAQIDTSKLLQAKASATKEDGVIWDLRESKAKDKLTVDFVCRKDGMMGSVRSFRMRLTTDGWENVTNADDEGGVAEKKSGKPDKELTQENASQELRNLFEQLEITTISHILPDHVNMPRAAKFTRDRLLSPEPDDFYQATKNPLLMYVAPPAKEPSIKKTIGQPLLEEQKLLMARELAAAEKKRDEEANELIARIMQLEKLLSPDASASLGLDQKEIDKYQNEKFQTFKLLEVGYIGKNAQILQWIKDHKDTLQKEQVAAVKGGILERLWLLSSGKVGSQQDESSAAILHPIRRYHQ